MVKITVVLACQLLCQLAVQSDGGFLGRDPRKRNTGKGRVLHLVGVEVQRGLSILARRDQTLFDARDGHVLGHVVSNAEFFMLLVKQDADHGC